MVLFSPTVLPWKNGCKRNMTNDAQVLTRSRVAAETLVKVFPSKNP